MHSQQVAPKCMKSIGRLSEGTETILEGKIASQNLVIFSL